MAVFSRMDAEAWLFGLLAAVVGGVATAGSTWISLVMAKGIGIDVPVLNWKALGMILLINGVGSFFIYLKQSPVPASKETTTITKEVTHEIA